MRSIRLASISTVIVLCIGTATALALAATGRGTHPRSGNQRPLRSVVLSPAEAPAGTRFAPWLSGADALERQGLTAQALQQLRRLGFEGDYGTQFYASHPHKALISATSVAARFQSAGGASQALELMAQELLRTHPTAKPLRTMGLGDEAWGYGGRLFREAPASYRAFYYAWRSGGLLLTVAMTGPRTAVTARRTRLLAERIAARAPEAGP